MAAWVQLALVSATSIAASSGFWAWLQSRSQEKSSFDKLLMMIVYKELTTQGMRYIQRGWITRDEYEDYRKLFYEPYKALGGNGVAERIMEDVRKLPMRDYARYSEVTEGDQR